MERHRELAQTALSKEMVSVLKLGLTSADLNLEEQEKMFPPQLWASHLEQLEFQATMSFLPSATKLCVGHLLLGPTVSQANNEAGTVASTMTGAGDQLGTSESEVEANSKENSSVAAPPNLPTSDSTVSTEDAAHPLTSAPIVVKKWLEGSSCLARCPEDGVWYRAKVAFQDFVKGDVLVTLIDYSKSVVVGANDIVSSVDELPEEERILVDKVVLVANAVKDLKQVEVNKAKVTMPEVDAEEMVNDENNPNPYCITKVEAALHDDSLLVETSQGQTSPATEINVDGGEVEVDVEEVNFCQSISAGQDCVAKWNEDDVWYRAQVAEVGKDGKVLVVFTDYGNSAYVGEGEFVAGVDGIPAGEEKDVNLVEAADAVIDDANLLTEEKNIEAVEIVEEKRVKSEYAEEARAVEEVEVVEEAKPNVEADIQVLPSRSQMVELKIDDFCVACFSEDNVW